MVNQTKRFKTLDVCQQIVFNPERNVLGVRHENFDRDIDGDGIYESAKGVLTFFDSKAIEVRHRFEEDHFGFRFFSLLANGSKTFYLKGSTTKANGEFGVFDTESGKTVWSRNTEGSSTPLLHPNKQTVAIRNSNQIVELRDLENGQLIREIELTDSLKNAKFSPNGRLLITYSTNVISIWDIEKGELARELKGHESNISCLCFSRDGLRIATGDEGGTIKIWDIASTQSQLGIGMPLEVAFVGRDAVETISWKGPRMVAEKWDLSMRQSLLPSLQLDMDVFDPFVFYQSNGRCLSARSSDGSVFAYGYSANGIFRICIWDLNNGICRAVIESGSESGSSIELSPNGKRLTAVLSNDPFNRDSQLAIWDTETGRKIKSVDQRGDGFVTIGGDRDGEVLLVGSKNGLFEIFDAKTLRKKRTINSAIEDSLTFVGGSDDDTLLLTGNSAGVVKVYDRNSGNLKYKFGGMEDESIHWVAVSPDHSRIVAIADHESEMLHKMKLWDSKSGEEVFSIPCSGTSCHLSKDGQLVVFSQSHQGLRFLDARPVSRRLLAKKANVDAKLHLQLATDAHREQDWFAETFHRAWVMKTDPYQARSYDLLHEAYKNLQKQQAEQKRSLEVYLAPVLKEMLPLPRGAILDIVLAKQVNGSTWASVKSPSNEGKFALTNSELIQFRDLVQQYPRGMYFNTLAVAEFRLKNLKEAIQAALQSVELTPKEMDLPCPHPSDLAVLAMSHLELDNVEEAKEYRKHLDAAIKLDAFKDDEECQSFAEEVETLFSGRAKTPANDADEQD
jgi:WD40 repeat protein